MKDQKIQAPGGMSLLFLSWFYTGKFPKAPGTVGSLATLPLILLLHQLDFNIYALITLIVLLYAAAVIITERVQKKYGLKDPQWIVIDEVIGMLITWAFVMKVDPLSLSLIFITFRFFDIIKIWPASYFDRLHHGFGTITDDVISAFYAGLTILLFRTFF